MGSRMTVGQKVLRLGAHFRLTQEELAGVVGVHRGTIATYKHRPEKGPSREKVRALASRFGVPLEWFFEETDTTPPIPRDPAEAEALAKRRRGPERSLTPNISIERDDDAYEDHPEPIDRPTALRHRLLWPTEDEGPMFYEAAEDLVELPEYYGLPLGQSDEWRAREDETNRKAKVPHYLLGGQDKRFAIVLRPGGASMGERMVHGDRVVVQPFLGRQPDPGTIVLALSPEGTFFLKVLRVRNGRPTLETISPDFEPVDLDGWSIWAVATAIWRPYVSTGMNIEHRGGRPLTA